MVACSPCGIPDKIHHLQSGWHSEKCLLFVVVVAIVRDQEVHSPQFSHYVRGRELREIKGMRLSTYLMVLGMHYVNLYIMYIISSPGEPERLLGGCD